MRKLLSVALLSTIMFTSCGKEENVESQIGVLNLSVYYHFEDAPSEHHLAKDSYCWFGLFDCEQSSISADQKDVFNIGDNKVVKLKDGKTVHPMYFTTSDVGTCTLNDVAFGRYTVVCVYRNGTRPTSSNYYYYATKTLNIDNPAANTCRFVFEVGMDKYGKLINQ